MTAKLVLQMTPKVEVINTNLKYIYIYIYIFKKNQQTILHNAIAAKPTNIFNSVVIKFTLAVLPNKTYQKYVRNLIWVLNFIPFQAH